MLRVIHQEWKFFIVLTILLVVAGVAYYEYKQWRQDNKPPVITQPNITINTEGQLSKQGEPQVVYIQGQSTNTREIVYVPKEIDPKTNAPEKTDVQFERKQGVIYVKVNGKEYEVPANVTEDAKFEKGKLVVTEQSEVKINITAPKPAFNMGLGWSRNGPAAQMNGPLYKNVSWWVYGDKKTVAGGIQFPIMK